MLDNKEINILIIDDEKNIRKSIALILEDAGYKVNSAEDAIKGLEKLRAQSYDLVILDIRLGDVSGLQVFKKIRDEKITTPVLFISGNASLSEAVETIKLGGTDFLEKPFAPERLLIAVTRALRIGQLEHQLSQLHNREISPQNLNDQNRYEMIGSSPSMKALWMNIEKVAPTRSKVLILGESGTGKELIARAMHKLSHLSKGPFVKVNCAAIPSELIESELFGHERGAFTGATQLKRGFFELAHRGTIFLDEIAEMSASAQAKVLRVLQNQEFTRVGGSQIIQTDVRIIAATHRDLSIEVNLGKFREDLFFRLNVVPIRSTPLRDRKEDIPLLFSSFLKEFCEENGFTQKEISPEALLLLMNYSWPGNVRELRNLAERLCIFSGTRISIHDLPDDFQIEHPQERLSSFGKGHQMESKDFRFPSMTLDQFKKKSEREFIISVLKKTKGHISQAANLLDLERTYLHRKIHEHQIKKSEYFE